MLVGLCSVVVSSQSSSCPPSSDFSSKLSSLFAHYLSTLIDTLEVAMRGFLLGFGVTVLKDLLIDGKRGEEDIALTCQYGKAVGLGMACTLVGASVMIPTRWQEKFMDSADKYFK